MAGWAAGKVVDEWYYGPPLRLADNARRFDISDASFSWVGAAPALQVIEQRLVEAQPQDLLGESAPRGAST